MFSFLAICLSALIGAYFGWVFNSILKSCILAAIFAVCIVTGGAYLDGF